jgi:CsoR family transcriptional regulator, copper-sensing transcriptional repressor
MDKAIQKKAIRRLRIAAGQVKGLEKMVAEEKYCIDIINQSLAIKQALSGVEDLVLENHLSTHVAAQMRRHNENKAVREMLSIYKLSKRK